MKDFEKKSRKEKLKNIDKLIKSIKYSVNKTVKQ